MARLQVAPTRSNLLTMRENLELAREGFEILDRKREVLTTELVAVAGDASRLQERVRGMLSEAYRALEGAQLSMGREHLEWAALSVDETVEVELRPHSIMGVVLPVLTAHGAPPEIPYGLGDTSVLLDEVVTDFRQVLGLVPQLAEIMTTVWKLARELQKTRRRVNALQYVFIPQYEETIAYIESALEEREREEIFRLKRLKSQSRQAGEGAEDTAED